MKKTKRKSQYSQHGGIVGDKHVKYDHKAVEKHWQGIWDKSGIYKSDDFAKERKYYLLVEFPYPSGAGLHVGHVRSWASMDAFARKKRMEGFNVMYPMGWDAFGLPAENYAIKTGIHPSVTVPQNIAVFKKQCKSLGLSFDWSRELDTTDPKYYKWTQLIFIKLFKKGLSYRREVPVNWCPKCKTNLADEEVLPDGTHERCGDKIETRSQKQWLLRITDYADRLLDDLNLVDYSQKIRVQQENWIGRKEWIDITYPIADTSEKIVISTTRPDTNFGATFIVVAPEHPLVKKIIEKQIKTSENLKNITNYIDIAKSKSELERISEKRKKTGVFTGLYAVNQLNDYRMPIYITDFVLMSVGTGAVVGVPAHDERDYSFARTFKLPIKKVVDYDTETHSIVIKKSVGDGFINEVRKNKWYFIDYEGWGYGIVIPKGDEDLYIKMVQNHLLAGPWFVHTDGILKAVIFKEKYFDIVSHNNQAKEYAHQLKIPDSQTNWDDQYGYMFCYTGDGVATNSGFLNGLSSVEAIKKIMDYLEDKGWGKRTTRYHLHDWIFSRQHYWGEPIPMVYCQKCAKEGKSYFTTEGEKSLTHGDQSDWDPSGWFPVLEEDLPLELPYLKKYEPSGTGESPLANAGDWISAKCPNCAGVARRETDTMPNWAGSNWYFVRYADNKNDMELIDRKKADYWLPVDFYQGGFEHTTLHLLYSRFIYKFLYDLGTVATPEPYLKRRSHGIVLGADNRKMSKSFGNVINPDQIVVKYGADTLRLYEMFMGPFENVCAWSEESLEGCYRFLSRLWRAFNTKVSTEEPTSAVITTKLHQTIKKVTEDLDNLKFNTVVSSMMELLNLWEDEKTINKKEAKDFIKILAPFAPHLAEEVWQKNFAKDQIKTSSFSSIHLQPWPAFNKKYLVSDTVQIAIQVNGKLRATMTVDASRKDDKEYVAVEAKKIENVSKWLEGHQTIKQVFIPGRLINFVLR